MKDEFLECRVRLLKDMDLMARSLNDEESGYLDYWLQEGVPDGATEEDYIELAEDESIFFYTIRVFANITKNNRKFNDYYFG